MPDNDTRQTIQSFYDWANPRDLERYAEIIGEDCVIHSPVPVEGVGVAGFQALLGVLLAGVPDHRAEVHDIVVDGDHAVARHTHHGTHSGELLGVPPSGNAISVGGIEQFRLRDGKIVEFWHYDDMLSLMQQIGAVPAAG